MDDSMMPIPPIGSTWRNSRTDRSSFELRAYLRDEWRSNLDWLAAQTPRRNSSFWSRMRRWFLARARRREDPSRGRAHERSPSPPPPDWLADVNVCSHSQTEDLGYGGGAEFLQCIVCGVVLVVHGGREWRISPSPSEVAPLPERSSGEDLVSPALARLADD